MNSLTSPGTSRRSQDIRVVMNPTEQHDRIMFRQACQVLSKLRNWDKEKWLDAPGRSADKPRVECCEDKNGTIMYTRAVQGHSHGARINTTSFFLKDTVELEKEHVFHACSSSNFKSILENDLWARGLSRRGTRQHCFFSAPDPQEPSSRQRTTDWKGLDDKPSMVLYKQSYRPDHDCF